MTLSLAAHAPPLRQDHGALRVGRSNVTLESVLIIDQFPTITLADAYEVVGYYLRNRAQVDVYLGSGACPRGAGPGDPSCVSLSHDAR